uniref:Uncharacterized protein n=1 Tax=Haemonchus contortus TaxID=6289 RepID=A0A7I4Y1Y8_HAECO
MLSDFNGSTDMRPPSLRRVRASEGGASYFLLTVAHGRSAYSVVNKRLVPPSLASTRRTDERAPVEPFKSESSHCVQGRWAVSTDVQRCQHVASNGFEKLDKRNELRQTAKNDDK